MLRKYAAHNSLLPFYLAWQVDPDGNHYNLNFSYQLAEAEVDLLTTKLQELIQLKAYLRQTFVLENDLLMACIHDHLPAEVNFFTSSIADFAELEQVLVKESHDINAKSSIRLNIIRFNDSDSCVVLFNIHHIIMDGMSLSYFIMELNRLIAGEKVDSESSDVYILKIARERPLKGMNTQPNLAEYIKEINEIVAEVNYPIGNKDMCLFYTDTLPTVIGQKLTILGKQHQISTYNLLLLAWGVFTAKLFNQKLALVNYPVNIRFDKSIFGCFVNLVTLPLRLSADHTYLSLIRLWHDKIAVFKKAAQFRLDDRLNLDVIPSFAHSNVAQPDELIIQGKRYTAKSYQQISHSNLSVKYHEKAGKFYFCCEHLAGIFPNYFASSLLPRFFNYLNKLLADPFLQFSKTDLTFTEEKQQLLYDFNDTDIFYPQDKTLVDLFEEQVKKTPDNIALVYGKIVFTYAELNKLANQLAHYLRNHYQIKPDDLIALYLDRNEFMLISILAVLKSGAAYVPIETAYPQERVHYILEDTKAKIILTNTVYQEKINHLIDYFESHKKSELKSKDVHVIPIDNQEIQDELTNYVKTNLDIASTSTNLAYVIYTSGTTGRPKGVMIEHRGVINTVLALDKAYRTENNQLQNSLKITAFTSYVFDVSVSEFFIALVKGHELHILSNSLRKDVNLISRYINTHRINCVYLPPVLLARLPKITYPSLQVIIYAGEPCDAETGLYWSKKCKLHNYYGPTEASIYATGSQLEKGEVCLIGKPLSNTTVYVLSAEMNLLPIGIIGELYIGGAGLARGYLNQPEHTAERFIINSFQTEKERMAGKNSRLYKTGDLVRWLPDGNLEYIGRDDFQVKIRGYRVELNEIENKLSSYPGIQQVIVLAKNYPVNNDDKNDKYLVAYYLANKKLDESMLYDYCIAQLPEYMLPSVFVHLNRLPLTINGKIDRKYLPDPELEEIDNYVAPVNKQEKLICSEFSRVLGIKKVGVNDNFFHLGGSSIKAITLVARLQTNFNINVSDIYNLKTPKQIAKKTFFEKNNLKRYLKRMKLIYQVKNNSPATDQQLQDKLNKYMVSLPKLFENFQKKLLGSVLLTGATGFLGCNLLNEILSSTDYRVFLLIRAPSHEDAYERINKKFQFYFDKTLNSVRNLRLFVFSADIEQNDLALSATDYQTLVAQVDSIIHSAAMTKHYGESDRFYSANVQATINLLELCKLTRLKDFHYISTISVFQGNHSLNYDQSVFTEDDLTENIEDQRNIYIKTKCQGEEAVINYRQYDITSNIYRVGNLAFMASNCRAQENSEDNGFFNRIKCILNLGIIAEEMNTEEISPVDLTAQAIIKLFDKRQLKNCTYHVFNSNLYKLADFFSQNVLFKVKVVSINQFLDTIIACMGDPSQQALIERFLVHQGWLNKWDVPSTFMRTLQDRTHLILQQLGFKWLPINDEIFRQYLKMEVRNDSKIESTTIS